MKNAIISFLMSAVVATSVGWVKDKMAFPITAVEKLKGMAAEADIQGLAMKSMGSEMDHTLLLGLPNCLSENKGASEPCVAKGMEMLKSTLAKRGEAVQASTAIQASAGELKKLVDSAPFSDSIKPLLEPITKRLETAQTSLATSQEGLDGGMAAIAQKLMAMKNSDDSRKQLTELVGSMKTAGLEKALIKVGLATPPPPPTK